MKCELCSEPATVHITDMSQGKHQVLHLCGKCAEKEEGGLHSLPGDVEQIVEGIIAVCAGDLGSELGQLTCPHCGTQYIEFRTRGRLGCPADYEAFQQGLVPMLQRIHGSTEHTGKCPRRIAPPQAELIRLRRELRLAVEQEAFEEAARLRDLIRAKEIRHEPE